MPALLGAAMLAGCAGGGTSATAASSTPRHSTSVTVTTTSPPPTTTAPPTPAAPVNKTGPATIPDTLGGACHAFTLAFARQVLPDLPDQTMDLGDGHCTYADPPDASNQVTTVEFVRPYDNQPGWAAQAQTRMATGGQATPVAVGDGGFCADQGGGAIVVGWQRASTGFELDAFSPSASCANVTTLALALNNSL